MVPLWSTEALTLSPERISLTNLGNEQDSESRIVDISEDGVWVTFHSEASNLFDGSPTVSVVGVYLYNTQTGNLILASKDTDDSPPNDNSDKPSISADGRYIAFESSASDLVADDLNTASDIFVYDKFSDTVEIVSLTSGGLQADGNSTYPLISSDGRYVVFSSLATNLVAGDTNGESDIFMYDRQNDTIERISVSSAEAEANGGSTIASISDDNNFVVFDSNATNLVAGDTNNKTDIFIRNITAGTTERISVSSAEAEGNNNSQLSAYLNNISEDGNLIVFSSTATNLVSGDTNVALDVFIRNITAGTTERLSINESDVEGNGASNEAQISSTGRYVSFMSSATNLVSDADTNGGVDIFILDRDTDNLERVDVGLSGAQISNAGFYMMRFTSDLEYLLFASEASNIVNSDTNGVSDVFFIQMDDNDGISRSLEESSPNSGDVDDDDYADYVQDDVTSFINSVTNGYTTIKTTGNCTRNDSPSVVSESSLGTQDANYNYPIGIVDFSITCDSSGETAEVTLYSFTSDVSASDIIPRKYNRNTGEYIDIIDAEVSQVSIDGQIAIKIVYDVTDGGELDEDGSSNGVIVDPIGLAQSVPTGSISSGGSSSRSQKTTNKVVISTEVEEGQSNPSCEVFATNMKLGSKFGEVSKLQQRLNSLGFNTGVVDGWFGKMTQSGVKAFQLSKNLVSDGIVGPMTRGELNKLCK